MVLLISGHMGSGKSILRKTLHVPPKIIIFEGFHCFAATGVPYHKHVRALKSKRNRANFRLAGVRFGFAYYLYLLRMRTLINRHVQFSDVEEVLNRTFPQADIIGDNTSQYLPRLDLTSGLPGVKNIVVYRDPRDVASEMKRRLAGQWKVYSESAKKNPWIQDIDTPKKIAKRWLVQIERMKAHQEKIYPVRYEELVMDPPAILAPLARWLGVQQDLVRYDFIRKDRVGDYRYMLSEQEVSDVLEIAGPAMKRLEYL